MTTPSPPAAELVRPGLWSIPVPIAGNPLGVTLVYCFETDAGPVLVDAGWHDEAAFAVLRAGVEATGAALEDVYGVLVTHHHPDHLGLAGRVRDASGAWIALHPEDTVYVQRHRDYAIAGAGAWAQRARAVLEEAGASAGEIEVIVGAERRMEIPLPPVPDRDLVDGERADVPGWDIRAVWAPGHSPGHTCFVVERDDLLLSGDHLLPGITPHVGLYETDGDPGFDPLGDYLASLRRIAGLGAREVLPAHEHRFDKAEERAAEILDHHAVRLAELEAAVAERSRTPWQLAKELSWSREWAALDPTMHRLALGELAAHLRHLEILGRVRPVAGSAPARYEPALTADGDDPDELVVRSA